MAVGCDQGELGVAVGRQQRGDFPRLWRGIGIVRLRQGGESDQDGREDQVGAHELLRVELGDVVDQAFNGGRDNFPSLLHGGQGRVRADAAVGEA